MGLATFSGPVAVDEEKLEAGARNSSGRERRAKERVRLLTERGSAELGVVASGSATHSFLLGDRKVGSQVIGEDQDQLPGRGTVKKVRRGGT